MAAHVKVLDTTLKTTTVKVTPGTYMTDVLEEACKKFGRDATNFTLKHKEKPLNLSLPFRQTGLISGAKLELIAASRSPTPVKVALQLTEPDGKGETKLIIDASSDKTLWRVLRMFEDEKERKLRLTDRPVQRLDDGTGTSGAGRLFYEEPVLNIMGRQISGLTELQKTLAQFGITDGTVSMRISFRPTNIPFEEAIANIKQFFDEPSDVPAESSTPQPSPVAQVSDSSPALSDVTNGIERMATPSSRPDDSPSSQTPAAFVPKPLSPAKRPRPESEADVDDGKPLVYRPPSGDTPKAAQIPHDEKAYEHSISQVKSHQALLNKASTNKKLLSDAEEKRLEEEKAAKLSSVKEVNVKVRMPNQFALQFSKIGANDTCLELYKRVVNATVATDQQFKLVYPGETGRPETIPKDDKRLLIKHLGFRGNVLVNFHWLDGVPAEIRQGPILKSELTEKAQDINIPMVDAPEVEDEAPLDNDKGKGKAPEKGGSEEKRKKMLGNLMQRFAKK